MKKATRIRGQRRRWHTACHDGFRSADVRRLACALALTVLGTALCWSSVAFAQVQEKKFIVIGTWSFINNWKKLEQPFWTSTIVANSGGKITADLKSVTDVNLKGTEILRLLRTGVYDIAAAMPIYVDDGAAIMEASDISGVARDSAMQRKVLELWMPEMQKVMKERYNAQIMGTFAFPEQAFFCRDDISGVADLKGKKIRVQGVSQADLVRAFGASAVTMPFGEVVPALEKGVVDCGITGAMPGYQAKWPEVVKTLFILPVGYSVGLWAVNLNVWNKLSKPTQEFMTAEFKKLENMSWEIIEQEHKEGVQCATGSGRCSVGRAANLKLVMPSTADLAARDKALNDVVLAAWAKRCGSACAAKWTDIVGKSYGLIARAD
jgi:TRAP-type C4-dicarboxylate transport system substrate-binding protein